ncbi:trypsin-like peptidase domain-containing protein [Robiginitalea sp. M366]|uniref:trypsin-like peptidase domain-containing protein n=1 Tax=Robiginitalea aestuariiviva TaxID=3036903 RepID=UPI00240E67FE|nr:trypsin-like peptidase domain-containing protein [Robiginitalea aestuariiviva]MDG1573157.1 trypsin-like peptidase domain-containing protein [Robiginitalea aestuariiviva]
MKRIAGLFFIALLSGAITLGAYILFFEPHRPILAEASEALPVWQASTASPAATAAADGVDFTYAAENTINAVVHVKNLTLSRGSVNLFDFLYGYEERARPQVGTGSGVIISPEGYIVTNNHVIARATQLTVTLNNNKTYEANVVGVDPNSDIALLKIQVDEPLPYLTFGDSDQVHIGEWVLAVGNPYNLTSTVTAGIVSAKARDLGRNQSFIQTDAAVNPGNSGGALVNTKGQLVGINTAITSQTGSYIGYSFAVPSNIARKIVEDLLEYGDVQKGILGIESPRLDTEYAIKNGIDEIDGVYVDGIEEDSGAQRAGLERGDVIRSIDEVRIRKWSDLVGYIATKRPGDTVAVALVRNGNKMVVPVEVRERQTAVLPRLGLTVKNLSDRDKERYGVNSGVKVIGVPETFRRYDLTDKIILALDGQPVNNIEDAQELFSRISRYSNTSITMLDENGQRERFIFQ